MSVHGSHLLLLLMFAAIWLLVFQLTGRRDERSSAVAKRQLKHKP